VWGLLYRALHCAERTRVSKNLGPSAAIMDSESVKTTEEGARSNGYDAHKNLKGRKRHLLVDTLGLPLSVNVTPANVQDWVGARLLLVGLNPLVPRLKKIWADGAYSGEELARWCEERGGWKLEIVERDREAEGFEVLPKRWIVERTFSWLIRNRRLSKDYERMVQTSETLIELPSGPGSSSRGSGFFAFFRSKAQVSFLLLCSALVCAEQLKTKERTP
jgi:putative transposase